MHTSSEESGSEVSEDEYEVEYKINSITQSTSWAPGGTGQFGNMKFIWEPEGNLTKYGSAGLVDRFWKEWPKKRYSRPLVGTGYRATADLLIEERKRFLANRPKDQLVRGLDRPKKSSSRPVLIGDPESDDDILAPTEDEEEDDEDILRSSSSEDIPLNKVSRSKPTSTSSSARVRSKAPLRATSSAGKRLIVPQKARPSVSHPTVPTSSGSAKLSYPAPTVKATKIAKEPIVHSRRGKKPVREEMQAGSISKDFGGIGTKGKQVERAGEIMALGRRGSGSAGPAPIPKPTNVYSGISMRKTGQGSGSNAPNTSTGAGPSRVGSGMPVDSPMEMSPVGMLQRQASVPELPTAQLIDDFVSGIQAEIQPEVQSPRDSLFDDPGNEEDQPLPQMDLDIDFGAFGMNSPPPVFEPLVPSGPQPQLEPEPAPAPALARPTISTDIPPARSHLDNLAHANTPSPLVQGLVLQSPVSAIPPLQPGQWHWTGDLFVTTQELVASAGGSGDGEPKTKDTRHRVCEVVIRDPAIPDEAGTKIFTSTLGSYIKGQITIQNMSDLHMLYTELGAGAFELTQAAWMVHTDAGENADLDLWRGVLRKMETTMQGTIVKIYNANNVQTTRHLLLVPCTLMRKFRRLQPFIPVAKHFESRTGGFAVVMCRRVQNMVEPEPRPLLAQKLPEYWQQIPPELHGQLRGARCLVFPSPDSEPESGVLHAELAKCNAVILDALDTGGHAEAVFVHRAWVWQLSGVLGLTHRRKRPTRRFYVFGSGGLWTASEWDVREIWLVGGMVTFTPAALLEDPSVVNRVVETIQNNVTWHAYIEPKVIGTLTLRKHDEHVAFVLEKVLDEIAFSNDFAPFPLALTSPPRRGLIEEFEWVDAQYARVDKTSEDLRKSCEEEVINAYEKEMEVSKAAQETAPKAKPKEPGVNNGGWGGDVGGWGESGGGGGGGGGWGDTNTSGWGTSTTNENTGWGDTSGGWSDPSGAANGWGSPPQSQAGRGSPGPNTPLGPNAEALTQVDPSKIASDERIREMSDAVIEGLKTMQIQPCFMREIRRFIVIDSKARAKEKEGRSSKIEVEVVTAEQFIADFMVNG
ncbi:hypothetical protein FRC10_004873 [Ceratobasidium sp. 414]|nr:hypothetical protein FRC10_004873 [Ceratobasidium sp. 414]